MKKTALASGILALVLGLTACGGGESGSSGGTAGPALFGDVQELVRAASAKTGQVQSAKFTISGSIAGQQMTGSGEGRFNGPDSAIAMTMSVGGQSQEMRIVDKVLYLKLPEEAQAATGGKPWATFPEGSEAAKTLGASLEQAESNDPSKTLEQIEKAGTITRSEQTTLDGQQVSHYWVTIDVAKASDELASSGLPAETLEQLKSMNVTYPMELWLNSDQLPVQITQDLGPVMQAVGAPAEAQQAKITMKYSDWGAPVDVTAPPADQVGELKIGG
ncbi:MULTISPECIES: hypothetical protein [Amycolatopsis]|uniref:LppX_LprAFG lipoprotein n=1 Tax=Amycolatopsis tucumanensis TaxID=401106 RepID=A0ABP7INR0_9PSEU|nr:MULTISPECIES: hypothetical protein [Amycolatopsis]MCF6428024.1 hypothetical protein [Amycolatopsis tucumanensis]